MDPISPQHPRPRIALVGAGRVGTAIAVLFQRAGCEITGVWSRSGPSRERAASLLEAPDLVLAEPVDADLVILGAGDPAIEEVATAVAPCLRPGTVVAHLSGSLGLSPLREAIAAGASGVAMHPVQACPDVATAIERLPGSAWGVTADPAVAEVVDVWIRDLLAGTPVRVAEEHRPVWHAACVMTSNGIAALMAFGETLLDGLGYDDPEKILGPLARGTVMNALDGGGGGATLTGPVVRGEAETLKRHLHALEETAPELIPDYKGVVAAILAAARRQGRIDAATIQRIEEVLR